mgnify:CR=1 FL=1
MAGRRKQRFDACVYAQRCRKIARVDVEHKVASAEPVCAAGARELEAARAVGVLVRGFSYVCSTVVWSAALIVSGSALRT